MGGFTFIGNSVYVYRPSYVCGKAWFMFLGVMFFMVGVMFFSFRFRLSLYVCMFISVYNEDRNTICQHE